MHLCSQYLSAEHRNDPSTFIVVKTSQSKSEKAVSVNFLSFSKCLGDACQTFHGPCKHVNFNLDPHSLLLASYQGPCNKRVKPVDKSASVTGIITPVKTPALKRLGQSIQVSYAHILKPVSFFSSILFSQNVETFFQFNYHRQ